MTQPTVEGIYTATPKSPKEIDLRPPGWEADKAAVAANKASLLDKQANTSVGSPAGMDGVTSGPASPTMQVGAEATKSSDESKNPLFALPHEPSTPAADELPEAVSNSGALGLSPTDTAAAPQTAPVAEQPTKKPGFFGKLFGKK